ncbi:MAG: hypothetical protein HZB26_23745 [Candidatus Hydrogenedentes bacterium]|nr:hypothetical protein [Candidatus Hydrogenedentota bacterium]
MDRKLEGPVALADATVAYGARVREAALAADFNPVMVRILWLQNDRARVTAPGLRPARRLC